jgi:hypothetical protein
MKACHQLNFQLMTDFFFENFNYHNQRTIDFNHFENRDERTNGFLGNSLMKLFLQFEKLQLYVRIKYLKFL